MLIMWRFTVMGRRWRAQAHSKVQHIFLLKSSRTTYTVQGWYGTGLRQYWVRPKLVYERRRHFAAGLENLAHWYQFSITALFNQSISKEILMACSSLRTLRRTRAIEIYGLFAMRLSPAHLGLESLEDWGFDLVCASLFLSLLSLIWWAF